MHTLTTLVQTASAALHSDKYVAQHTDNIALHFDSVSLHSGSVALNFGSVVLGSDSVGLYALVVSSEIKVLGSLFQLLFKPVFSNGVDTKMELYVLLFENLAQKQGFDLFFCSC